MATEKLGQEPAFATSAQLEGEPIYQAGMSKRFYAACAAMQGMLAAGHPYDTEDDLGNLNGRAYDIADNLLVWEPIPGNYETQTTEYDDLPNF